MLLGYWHVLHYIRPYLLIANARPISGVSLHLFPMLYSSGRLLYILDPLPLPASLSSVLLHRKHRVSLEGNGFFNSSFSVSAKTYIRPMPYGFKAAQYHTLDWSPLTNICCGHNASSMGGGNLLVVRKHFR